jgi:hypothetical protein
MRSLVAMFFVLASVCVTAADTDECVIRVAEDIYDTAPEFLILRTASLME